jgi:hypothetical protein
MNKIRIIAVPTEVANAVRETGKAPRYGHPVHREIASGYGPCRHCLKAFRVGTESRTLFTYDPFSDLQVTPLPGPVFIHSDGCGRYPEDGGYPDGLRQFSSVLMAYGKDRRLVAETQVDDGSQPSAIQKLLDVAEVEYVHVHDKNAGCFDFRVERLAD